MIQCTCVFIYRITSDMTSFLVDYDFNAGSVILDNHLYLSTMYMILLKHNLYILTVARLKMICCPKCILLLVLVRAVCKVLVLSPIVNSC